MSVSPDMGIFTLHVVSALIRFIVLVHGHSHTVEDTLLSICLSQRHRRTCGCPKRRSVL